MWQATFGHFLDVSSKDLYLIVVVSKYVYNIVESLENCALFAFVAAVNHHYLSPIGKSFLNMVWYLINNDSFQLFVVTLDSNFAVSTRNNPSVGTCQFTSHDLDILSVIQASSQQNLIIYGQFLELFEDVSTKSKWLEIYG